MKSEEMRFEFGKNWEKFIKKHYNEERLQTSHRHILQFLGLSSLKEKYFLDIGCGSGLHSLAAYKAGAKKIVSFDYDHNSVKITNYLREISGNPTNWHVMKGSILDKAFLNQLEPADIVYSWGVLHHTGDMWTAIQNTIELMLPTSLLYIALYDYGVQVNPTPEFWLDVKQRYNKLNWLGKRKIELWYIWRFSLGKNLLALPALMKRVLNHGDSRGMAFYTDVKDWLGGWPMEFAKVEDVKRFCQEKAGLEIIKLKTGEANAEYLFRKEKMSSC